MNRRRALVVGAARGIGLAIARQLLHDGHRVTGTWRNTEPDLIDSLRWVRCDITDPDQVDELFERAEDDPFDILVANAALLRDRFTSRMSDEDFRLVLDVNVTGTFRVVRAGLGPMVERRWGRVILISSVGAAHGNSGQANYSASKAALEGMCASIAREVGPRDVTVNVILPGATSTELVHAMSPRLRERWVAMTPMEREADPSEIARIVSFLADDAAAAITGAAIPVDGGFLA